MKKPLPTEENRRQEFLFDNFFGSPEEKKFNGYTTENWQSNFTAFAEALLQKANDLKLDSASLRQVLDLVRKRAQDKLAYLPDGAYQTSLDTHPVWIITVKWEEYPPASGRNETLPLIHICAIAFDQKTSKEVGFATCN